MHHLFGSLSTDIWEIDEANIEMLPVLCVKSEHGDISQYELIGFIYSNRKWRKHKVAQPSRVDL